MSARRLALVAIAACVALVGCPRSASKSDEWPELPKSNEAARSIFASTGKRPTAESPDSLQDEAASDFVRAQITSSGVSAGWEAIDAQLARWVSAEPNKDVVVAFGTSHDSPAQIDAFRRLVGPRSTVKWTRILLEQLYADGRWKNVDAVTQAGDDEALDRYAKSGSREDIAALVGRVQRDAYTAWKYGSVDVIGDLIVEARAADRPVSGCDMAPALRAKLASLDEMWVHHMREVHCALAMRDRAKKSKDGKDGAGARIAALWGRNHVRGDAFPRLVPPDWTSFRISVMNAPTDSEVVLVDPILVVGGQVVLPSVDAAKRFERKRTKPGAGGAKSSFSFTTKKSSREPVAWVDGTSLDRTPKTIPPGRHLLTVDKGGTMIAAAIEIPANGAVEVTVADDAPDVTATILAP